MGNKQIYKQKENKMKEYHKINGIYKRYLDGPNKGRFIHGEFSCKAYEYLFAA